MNRLRLLLFLIVSVFAISPIVAQNQNATSTDQQPTFKSNVRSVLVDVVVTNNDQPVTGLTKDKFEVLEDGKPQTIGSFEEHAGMPDVPELSRMAHLPPNVFSNAPLVKTGDAANILLLDSLNTEMPDQLYVRTEMIKYIKSIRPGTRLAIFTLSNRLRFVQGFTEDPALLMAAVNGKNSAGNPEPSVLLQTASEQNASQTLVAQMNAIAQGSGPYGGATSVQAAADALAAFQSENTNSQIGVRVKLTLEAIEQLAMYLQAIPGRKNVIWFSGSFPLNNLAVDQNAVLRQFGEEIAKTANLLTAARIAIYPIGVGAMGLSPNRMYDSAAPRAPDVTGARTATQHQVQELDTESTERVASEASLQELAKNTGGQYFIHTNGFNDVLDHVVKTGTYYYTLTYSPTNRNMDGRLRHITIKLTGGKYELAYRRGYYATDDFLSPVAKTEHKGDPLRPLMDHGTPDSTQILYTMKVLPTPTQPGTLEAGVVSRRAGDNQDLRGAVTRYSVTFTVPPEDLALETSADGFHHGNVEVTLLAYDRDGKPLNWMVRLLQVRVPKDHFEQAQANGVGFNVEIDVPASAVYFRSGLYDMGSSKAGTLEIPLAALVASASAPKQ